MRSESEWRKVIMRRRTEGPTYRCSAELRDRSDSKPAAIVFSWPKTPDPQFYPGLFTSLPIFELTTNPRIIYRID